MPVQRAALFVLAAIVVAGCSHGAMNPAADGGTFSPQSIGTVSDLHYKAMPLPAGFVPVAIMKDGSVPGSYGNHAAIFTNGKLTVLADDPECVKAVQSGGYVTATSSNVDGDVVALCNYNFSSSPSGNGVALYYHDGVASRLRYPKVQNFSFDVLAISINDHGIIVANIYNNADNESSYLYRLYRSGKQATGIAYSTPAGAETLNNDGKIANTEFDPGRAGYATLVGIDGTDKPILRRTCTMSDWINDADVVVGLSTGCTDPRAFVYSNGIVTFLPRPAREATGVNDLGKIIGEEKAGIFLYANANLTTITPLISPAANYTLSYLGSTGYGYLGGLADDGSFVATTGGGNFYLISKAAQ